MAPRTVSPISPTPVRILRRRAVMARTGLSSTTIWRLTRDGKFPTAVQLGTGSIGWYEHEIDSWVLTRARVKDEGRPSPNRGRRRDAHDAA